MTQAEMLAVLKIDLGIRADAYNEVLTGLLQSAAEKITAEGVSDLDTSSVISDAQLVIDYAAWKWRSRTAPDAMPKSLRWEINNRVFGAKARAT